MSRCAISCLDDFEKCLVPLVFFILSYGRASGLTCAFGALLFSSMAIVAKRRICTVAPLAYQNGPDTPYLYATDED